MVNNVSQRIDTDLTAQNIKKDINIFWITWNISPQSNELFFKNQWTNIKRIRKFGQINAAWICYYNWKIYVSYSIPYDTSCYIAIFDDTFTFITQKKFNGATFRKPTILIWNKYYIQEYNNVTRINLDDFSTGKINKIEIPSSYGNIITCQSTYWSTYLQWANNNKIPIQNLTRIIDWTMFGIHQRKDWVVVVTNKKVAMVKFINESQWEIWEKAIGPLPGNCFSYLEWDVLRIVRDDSIYNQIALDLNNRNTFNSYLENDTIAQAWMLINWYHIYVSWNDINSIWLNKVFIRNKIQ